MSPSTSEPSADQQVVAAARQAWAGLGSEGEVVVDAVEVHLVALHFRSPVRTSRGVHRRRPVVLVRVEGSGPHGPVEGWGECAALADTTYDPEDAAIAFARLQGVLAPALLDAAADAGGALADVAAVRALGRDLSAPLATAALEMAVADAHLRARRSSLADLLGVDAPSVAVGAVVGRYAEVGALLDRVARLVDAGYPRVKLKVGPGWDVAPAAAVVGAFGGLLVQVDANESYSPADPADRAALDGLDQLGLACIEQPYDRHDLEAHARLVDRLATPICLDEGVGSPGQVAEALARGACSAVCVKPARLGGIGPALDVVAMAIGAGVPVWMGGMFESSLARSVNAVIAALPGFAWPGDLAAVEEYLVDDIVHLGHPWAGRGVDGVLRAPLPRGPGVGPRPDAATVGRSGIDVVRRER